MDHIVLDWSCSMSSSTLPRAEGLGYHAPAPKSAAPRGWTAEGGCPHARKAFTSRTPLCIIIALRPGRSSAHILRRAGPSFPEPEQTEAAPFLCFSRCWRHKGGYHEPVPHLGFFLSGVSSRPEHKRLRKRGRAAIHGRDSGVMDAL